MTIVKRMDSQADLDSLQGRWIRILEMETDSLFFAFGEGTFIYGGRFLDFTGMRNWVRVYSAFGRKLDRIFG